MHSPKRLSQIAGVLLLSVVPLCALVDRDGDGVSDIWAALYPEVGAATADPDGDRADNRAEAVAGTNPLDSGSRLSVKATRDGTGRFVLEWPSVAGKRYRLERSADLATWIALDGSYDGTGGTLTATVTESGVPLPERQFWRVVVSDFDSDGDNVTDWEEARLGTDPFDFFNGSSPTLMIQNGNNQNSPAGQFAPQPLVVTVTDSSGAPLANAPVSFVVDSGSGWLASTPSAEGVYGWSASLTTAIDGTASVFYLQPRTPGIPSRIAVSTGAARVAFAAQSTFALDDLDGNRLPDSWEKEHFGTTGIDPAGDLDGDGRLNILEHQYGYSPIEPDSTPTLPDAPSTGALPGSASYCVLSLGEGIWVSSLANNAWIAGSSVSDFTSWLWHQGRFVAVPAGLHLYHVNSKGEALAHQENQSNDCIWDSRTGAMHSLDGKLMAIGHCMSENWVGGYAIWDSVDVQFYENDEYWFHGNDEDGALWSIAGAYVRKLGTSCIGTRDISNLGPDYSSAPCHSGYWYSPLSVNDNGDVITWANPRRDGDNSPGFAALNGVKLDFDAREINNRGVVIGRRGNWPDFQSGWWHAGCFHPVGDRNTDLVDLNNLDDMLAFEVETVDSEWREVLNLYRRTGAGDSDFAKVAISSFLPKGTRVSDASINDDGLIALSAFSETSNPLASQVHALLLVPASLALDANRDGEIKLASEDDSDATSADKPFRFWLNDDNDRWMIHKWSIDLSTFTERELDDADVGGDSDKNCNNQVIDSERDLEDLARLWISTQGLNAAFRSGDLQLGLKWTDVSDGNPAIRLFHAVEAEGGDGYLFNPTTASLQVGQTAATGAHGMAVGNLIEGTTPVTLPTALFAGLTETQPKTCLLFEGVRAGKGQLKLVILDKNGAVIGEGPGVWIELKEPGALVERYTCGDDSMGTVGALSHYPQTATFSAPTSEDEKDYVLYVHGYNMEDPLKQRWIETTYKRLYWLGYKGRVGGFSWPCAYGLVDQIYFDDSENRAWQAGERLKEHLVKLKSLGYRVHVNAHSQGNVVMGEALRLWKASGQSTPLVSTYIASQAAIAAHCYSADAPLMPDYQQDTPNVYACYWRAGDSARFPQTWPTTNPPYLATSIMQTTAGRWVNFYNPQDYALTAANGGIGSWENDQRLKPDNFYNWSVTNGFFKGWVPFETAYSFPDDRYAIFSYCAEARSVALGTIPPGAPFTSFTNLQIFGFADQHLWHSGQFRSFNAARYRYWRALMSACDLTPYDPNLP